MRTHLLRTFYPPTAVEPDTGRAANDADFARPADSKAAVVFAMPDRDRLAREDDYSLGGYAGI